MKNIIILVLVATAFATNLSAFEKIEKSRLGKTLLNTIALHMQTGEPLERVFQTLYDLEERYQNDQREDDAENKVFQQEVDGDLAVLNQELANLEQKGTELQARIDELQPQYDQKVGQRVAKLAELALVQKTLNEATEKRESENNDFEAQREEFTFVSGVLAEARRLFTDNLQAPAFLQKGQSEGVHATPAIFAQVASHLNSAAHKAAQMKHIKTYGKAIKLLAQLSVKAQQFANQELTSRIVQLIDDLQNQLQQAFDLARKQEDAKRQQFQAYSTLLQRDINKLNSAIANLDAEIQSLADQLAATHSSLNDNNDRYAAKLQQRDDRRAEGQQAAQEYQQRRSARDADRQTVSDLIGHLNTNLRDLKEYIAQRVAAGDTDLGQ
ncbi:unnamed protein product (macronuclear) [Paramecium tetraurelia]|uniref:Trichocyst matrix protein n=1 Tax=Paramecium tetraurelia TaxID=5888 RepID=A0C3M0_PARTE|nr:uncharacterized protein GSPATT00034866001 [Paramecium tetraurelia]CAK65387.1 unnamed protein product [Paramecium tetraurelia]|eukprot:XP_001432784.1 hypothetical protein (macronuclear) [Paramecium tetraurelia strain d4-2]